MDSKKLTANISSNNLYERLGVSPYATVGDIERQWHKLHDAHPEAAASLNEAQSILCNPILRSAYDQHGMETVARLIAQAQNAPAPMPPVPAPAPSGAPRRSLLKRRVHPLVTTAVVATVAGLVGGGGAWWLITRPSPAPKIAGVAPRAPQGVTAPKIGQQELLAITRANWGAGNATIDIVPRLKELTIDGRLALEVNATVLETDPAPAAKKRLLLNYTLNGRPQTGTFQEGAIVIIPANSPGVIARTAGIPNPVAFPPGPVAEALVIDDATWGTGAAKVSVADLLRSHITDGRLDVAVSNALLGDPAPNALKHLVVTFEYQGKRETRTYIEKGQLALGDAKTATPIAAAPPRPIKPAPSTPVSSTPPPAPVKVDLSTIPIAPSGLAIVQAIWGARDHQKDVTETLRGLIKENNLDMVAAASALGDPAANQPKELSLTYDFNAKRATATFKENEPVNIGGLKPGWAQRAAAVRRDHPNDLVVLDASVVSPTLLYIWRSWPEWYRRPWSM